jgi:hypothetical protein
LRGARRKEISILREWGSTDGKDDGDPLRAAAVAEQAPRFPRIRQASDDAVGSPREAAVLFALAIVPLEFLDPGNVDRGL